MKTSVVRSLTALLVVVSILLGSATASTGCHQSALRPPNSITRNTKGATLLRASSAVFTTSNGNQLDNMVPQPNPGHGGAGCAGRWTESQTVRCWRANIWWYATASCYAGTATASALTEQRAIRAAIAAAGGVGCAIVSIWQEAGWTTCRQVRECEWRPRYHHATRTYQCYADCTPWVDR
jgi:hypothetical protein